MYKKTAKKKSGSAFKIMPAAFSRLILRVISRFRLSEVIAKQRKLRHHGGI